MPRISQSIAMAVGTAGAMTDISSYADLDKGVSARRGKSNEYDDAQPGEFSFTLDNNDGRFTPGNALSALATTVTEGMLVCWQLGSRLVSGAVRSIEPEFPGMQSAWSQVRITCDDQLGNAARRTMVTPFVDAVNDGATTFLLWKLDDAVGTPVPAETTGDGSNLLSLSQTNGSPFGATAISGLGAGTQLTLKDRLSPTGGSAWPVFDFGYTTTSLGFYSFWITPTNLTTSKITCAVSLSGLARSLQFGYNGTAFFIRDGDSGTSATYTLTNTLPHIVSMGLTYVGTTLTLTLYVDGTSRGTVNYGTSVSSFAYKAPTAITLTAVT